MSDYKSPNRSPGFYDPEHRSPKTNGIIVAIFCVLFGGALWISLVDTLDAQQRAHLRTQLRKAVRELQRPHIVRIAWRRLRLGAGGRMLGEHVRGM